MRWCIDGGQQGRACEIGADRGRREGLRKESFGKRNKHLFATIISKERESYIIHVPNTHNQMTYSQMKSEAPEPEPTTVGY